MSVTITNEEFAKLLREKAKACDPEFQLRVGLCYSWGRGVEKNDDEAVKWYKLAADQNHAKAQNSLGYSYEFGEGVEKNIDEAVKLYKLSVEQGYSLAQNNLASCYLEGAGVPYDLDKALQLYNLSAEQGNWSAYVNLGEIYYNEKYGIQDLIKAKEYFEKAKLNFDYWESPAEDADREDVQKRIDEVNKELAEKEAQDNVKAEVKVEAARTEVFISYAHKDKQYRDELEPFLNLLGDATQIKWWDDTKINGGDIWREEIKKALAKAKVAIILGSIHFFDSDFIKKNELPQIFKAEMNDGATILWIPVGTFPYEDTVLNDYQAVTDPEIPLAAMGEAERHAAYKTLYNDIKKAFKKK